MIEVQRPPAEIADAIGVTRRESHQARKGEPSCSRCFFHRHMLCALDLHFATPREVAVVGESEELRGSALSGFQPNTVFAFAPQPTESVPLLVGKGLLGGRPAAYVCERFACQAPVTSPADLTAALI